MIRSAAVADAQAIQDLTRQLGYDCDTIEMIARLTRILDSDTDEVLIWEQEGTPIAWMHLKETMLLENGARAEIWGLVVEKDWRSRGVGKEMLRAAEEWAEARRLSVIRVRTRSTRHDAHRFYEREGFSLNKEQRVYEKSLGR